MYGIRASRKVLDEVFIILHFLIIFFYRTKILFAQNIAECKVKTCAKQLDSFLESINVNTDAETVNILLPHIRELIEDPPTSVLAVWYLFDPISRVLGE